MTRTRLIVLVEILAGAGLVLGVVVSTGTRGGPHASPKSTSGKWLHPVRSRANYAPAAVCVSVTPSLDKKLR